MGLKLLDILSIFFRIDDALLDTALVFRVVDEFLAIMILYECRYDDGDEAGWDTNNEDGAELYAMAAEEVL